MTTQAEAPSESWLALPAVTFASGPMTGCSAARPSSVVSGRLPSSLVIVTSRLETSPVSLSFTVITASQETISSSNAPAAWAAAVRCCDCSAYSSCAWREMP